MRKVAGEALGLQKRTAGGALLGEGPVWDHRINRLYWVDIEGSAIHRHDPVSGGNEQMSTPGMVGSVGLYGQRELIAASGRGLFLVDFDNADIREIPGTAVAAAGCMMNDGKADREGGFLFGAKDLAENSPVADAWIYDRGEVRRAETGFTVFNGPAFSPDGDSVYFADSPARAIFRAGYDRAARRIGPREVFATLSADEGYPDGMTVDAEGGLWNAHWDGWCVTRYQPDGKKDLVVDLPVRRPTSVCFGGGDMRTLFVTSASTRLTGAELNENPDAGALFSLRVDVPGLAEAVVRD